MILKEFIRNYKDRYHKMLKLSRPVVNLMCNAIENVSVASSRTLFAPSFFNVDKFANHSNYMQKKEANSKSNIQIKKRL